MTRFALNIILSVNLARAAWDHNMFATVALIVTMFVMNLAATVLDERAAQRRVTATRTAEVTGEADKAHA